MPLPFAPPPKDSTVYRDLSTKKISDLTPTLLDSFKENGYAQGVDGSEDELRRLRLLFDIYNSQSAQGVVADSDFYQVVTMNYDVSGTPVIVPDGQVIQVQLVILNNNTSASGGGSTSFNMNLQLCSLDETGSITQAEYLFDNSISVAGGGGRARISDNLIGLSTGLILTSRQSIRTFVTGSSGSPDQGDYNITVMGVRLR
jgi:hypothetical protein